MDYHIPISLVLGWYEPICYLLGAFVAFFIVLVVLEDR